MSRILLVGTEGGKRQVYFKKAAALADVQVDFLDWKDVPGLIGQEWQKEAFRQYVVKIDPPEWESSRLEELDGLAGQYRRQLSGLGGLTAGAFLNHPEDIAELLDKRICKERLIQEQIPVTQLFPMTFSRTEELLDFLREKGISQVFVKPIRGSGAAGVAALRYADRTGRLVLYTCAALEGGGLYNTKGMYRLEGKEAAAFLDSLLGLECVVERWHPKASFQGYCYDLRVVVQGGQVDMILPRLSKGPITNLHLNNHAMAYEDLHLSARITEQIQEVCLRAADCYPRLHSIGMDVLLEKGSLAPRIIEMNAQGDLLHRDAYGENQIYRRQVAMMQEMLTME